jgi:hypothetical protein
MRFGISTTNTVNKCNKMLAHHNSRLHVKMAKFFQTIAQIGYK